MKPEYCEAVVLVTIKRLNEKGIPCGIYNLVENAQFSNKTISKAIGRLEQKGRVKVIKGKPFRYEVKDHPTEGEYILTAVHLADRMVPNGR